MGRNERSTAAPAVPSGGGDLEAAGPELTASWHSAVEEQPGFGVVTESDGSDGPEANNRGSGGGGGGGGGMASQMLLATTLDAMQNVS